MRVIEWMKYFWGVGRARKEVSHLDRRVKELARELKRSEESLSNHTNSLNKTIDEFGAKVEKSKKAIEDAKSNQKKTLVELEGTRQQIMNLEEVVIEGLMKCNRTFISSWDAQSAMLAARSVDQTDDPKSID